MVPEARTFSDTAQVHTGDHWIPRDDQWPDQPVPAAMIRFSICLTKGQEG